MIPGRNNNKGRCYGVIDTYSFVEMLDAVKLLEQSKSFTSKDAKRLKVWFGKLLHWILNSPQGQEEANQANNHSTAHDAQAIAFALYSGNIKIATEIINAIPARQFFYSNRTRWPATARIATYSCLWIFSIQPDTLN